MSGFQSSGRGGAGNIVDSSKTQPIQPEDLQTPTLKTSMVTTGRGGTGNFAVGLDAEEKRRRQDVVPVVRRDSQGATHVGRGGTGNVVKESTTVLSGSAPLSAVLSNRSTRSATDKERKDKNGSPVPNNDDDDVAVPARKPEDISWAEKGRNLLFGKK
ncbi:hypothetical protein C8A05DRAFT_41268 [Staphylotrichum tortipilum]|uniref:Uncharacterized protein n=1 Tax=Staphylotrichum tortipilum TaxID=2831512 RepID=A0AAN6MS14_9PEZI|nr:hypothetical protein C8A05DRAFT_41268 [Staphylotrichum longicolle]